MTDESETTPGARLGEETRRVLDEVARHSRARTGTVARAIEAGLAALADDSVLSRDHCEELESWISMASESGGVGDRWISWRDAVDTLLDLLARRRGHIAARAPA